MKIKRLLVFLAVLVFVSNLFSSMTRGNDESFVGEGATYTCICIVNITSPEDESVVTKPEITVSGYASEECGIVYLSYLHKWENGSYRESWNIETPAPTYEFEFPITLREGWNSINVSAMGACGVTGFDEIIVFYTPDTEPPNIYIEYPVNGSVVTDTIINIIGSASDNTGISSWGYIHIWNGERTSQVFPLEISQQKIQIEASLELKEGQNIIKIFVVDEAGNNDSESIEITVAPEEGLLIESVFQPVQVVYQSDPLYGNDLTGGPCTWEAKLGMVAGKNTYLFGYPYNERNEIKIKVHNNYNTSKTFSFVIKIYPDDKEIWRSNPVTVPAKTKVTFKYPAPLPTQPFQWERWGSNPKIKEGSIVLFLDPDPTKPPADYHCEKVTVKVKIYYTHDLKVLFVPFTFTNGPDFPDDLKIPATGSTAFDRWRWDDLEPWWLAVYPVREEGLSTARSWLGNLKKSVVVDGINVDSLTTYKGLTAKQRYKVRLQLYRAMVAASWMTLYDRIVFLVHPDILEGANGMAIMSQANGNSKQGVIVNWSQRSKTAVHEVSHTYGLDESYTAGTPYKAVGYWVNRKIDVLNSENNKDLMWRTYPIWGATQKSWIKKPNFKMLLQRFNQQRDPEVVGIVGMIDKNDSITLYPWYKIDGYVDMEWGGYGDYIIKAYDENGSLINETGFNITFILNIGDTGGIKVNETIFSFRLEWLDGIAKIEIVNATSGKILAVRNVSENAPQVTITSPLNESVKKGLYTIKWDAFDADGDEMWFNLLISENGEEWFPLAIEIQNTSFTADFSMLNGTYKIKVVATDGINTGSDISQFFIEMQKEKEKKGIPGFDIILLIGAICTIVAISAKRKKK